MTRRRAPWSTPIPAILVAGDFRKNATTPFAKVAWRAVSKVYVEDGEDFGDPPATAIPPARPSQVVPGYPKSPRGDWRTLFPVQFSDEGRADAQTIRHLLYECFHYFDVWAIISCGTAANTKELFKALDFVGVPILITIDSTLGASAERQWDVLRLIPNNEQQAQAIVSYVKSQAKQEDVRAHLFGHPAGDRYVDDLTTAITAQAHAEQLHLPQLLNLEDLQPPTTEHLLVVYVGYPEGFRKLQARLTLTSGNVTKLPTVITSDGCYKEPAVAAAAISGQMEVLWTRPTVETEQYAANAYQAVCGVWREVGRESSHDVERGLSLQKRLIPLVEFVRQRLEEEFKPYYRFRRWDNQRGGYVLEAPSLPKTAEEPADGAVEPEAQRTNTSASES